MTAIERALPEREETSRLERFFRPRSIAVVGAHDSRLSLANMTTRLMQKADAVGATIYFVNPRLDTVFGRPTYRSIVDVPGEIDVMVVMVGDVVSAIDEAASKRPAFTVVFAAGYDELGTDEGSQRSAQLMDAVRRAGTRLVGPNTNINSLEVLDELPPPKIAVITQSGMQGRPLAQAQQIGVALSYWATTGNEADLEAAHFMEFFARDSDTRAIAAYIEGFKDGDQLRRAALAALEEDVPIVMIKVGRSSEGSRVAQSHTGHLAGTDRVHDAFFHQFGITRVDDMDELIEVSMVLARSDVPPADGVALLCNSGGTAAHLADLAGVAGVPVPELSTLSQEQLRAVIGDGFLVSNPIDNGGGSMLQGHGHSMMKILFEDPAIGVVLVPITGDYPDLTRPTVEMICQAREKPVIAIWTGPTTSEAYREILDAGIPVVRNLRNALTATRALLGRRTRLRAGRAFIDAARRLSPMEQRSSSKTHLLDEPQSMAWLTGQGLRFARHEVVDDLESAVSAAHEIGWPVVLKAVVHDVAHKSEFGLVAVGLAGPDALEQALKGMVTGIPDGTRTRWMVAEHMSGGVELIAGLSRDPLFGPVIMVGMGGVLAELHADVAMSVLPLSRERAHEMLDELRGARILDGWRGAPAVDRDAVVDVLLALADTALNDDWEEIDINPLLATRTGVVGLDALVRLGHDDQGDAR